MLFEGFIILEGYRYGSIGGRRGVKGEGCKQCKLSSNVFKVLSKNVVVSEQDQHHHHQQQCSLCPLCVPLPVRWQCSNV